MSNKFKVQGTIEGFDVHDDLLDDDRDYRCPSEPTTKEKLFILGLLIIPMLAMLGAAIVEAH